MTNYPRLATMAAAALIAGGGLAVTQSAPAFAASGCTVAPFSFRFNGYGSVILAGGNPSAGSWLYSDSLVLKTTSQCRDINVQNRGSDKPIRACVLFGAASEKCNHITYIPVGKWRTVATSVKDGTKFRLRLGQLVGGKPFMGAGATGVADF